MESIFENTTTLTRQNLTEMARATVPRWSLLVGIIPAVLAVAAAIWDLARRGISLWVIYVHSQRRQERNYASGRHAKRGGKGLLSGA